MSLENEVLEEESLFDVDDEGLFDDIDDDEFLDEEEEETEEQTDDEESEEDETPAEPEETEESDEEPYMTIRYNKQDKALSRDEAIALAQKGMNYDHINGQYQALNNHIESLARSNNMTVEQYLQSLSDMQVSFAVSKELDELRKKYPEADDELLTEIAEKRVNENFAREQKASQQTQQKNEDQLKKEIKRQVEVFEKEYPDLDPSKLDSQVYDLMDDGYTLLEAYNKWNGSQVQKKETVQSKKELIQKHNNANRKKKLGNLNNSDSIDADDFLAGFDS